MEKELKTIVEQMTQLAKVVKVNQETIESLILSNNKLVKIVTEAQDFINSQTVQINAQTEQIEQIKTIMALHDIVSYLDKGDTKDGLS